MTQSTPSASTVIPGLRYRDALAMIDWLCRAFGFERQAVYATPDGVVMHAQLTLGGGMVMIGSVDSGTSASTLLTQPDAIGGAETQAPYLVVADIDGAYARATRAGGTMVAELEAKPYGGKGFTCRDPEGHVWHVGDFDPWVRPASSP